MRQPFVSVIVPTFNSSAHLAECLRSINDQVYKNVELIVVDNNSSDSTKDVARRYTEMVFNHGPERSAQRNYGAKVSKGDYLLIIDSDMILGKEVIQGCIQEMQTNKYRALVIPEESFGRGFWAQCKRLERSFYVGVPWMEAARFFERSSFEEAGGYDERNTGTEDYDLPQRIQHRFGSEVVGRIGEFILHNEQTLSLVRTCKKKFYYAQRIHVYSKKSANARNFARQSSLIMRYKLFLSHPAKLLRNPVIGIGMLFMKSCEYASGAAGYLVGRLAAHEKRP